MVKNLSSSAGDMGVIPSQGTDYMYKCENWTIRKNTPEYSWEGLMLKLKL